MLGEKVGSLQASTTNKALPTEGALPRFETSMEGGETLAGADVQCLATYSSEHEGR